MKNTTPFLIANLALGILSFGLAITALVWQTVVWRMSGGRGKVTAGLGAYHESGTSMITFGSTDQTAIALAAKQGYTHPLIVVEVTNVGRLQLTVTQWMIVGFGGSFRPLQFIAGPSLPHTIEAGGAPESWAVDAAEMAFYMKGLQEVLKKKAKDPYVEIKLGNGKTIKTPLKYVF